MINLKESVNVRGGTWKARIAFAVFAIVCVVAIMPLIGHAVEESATVSEDASNAQATNVDEGVVGPTKDSETDGQASGKATDNDSSKDSVSDKTGSTDKSGDNANEVENSTGSTSALSQSDTDKAVSSDLDNTSLDKGVHLVNDNSLDTYSVTLLNSDGSKASETDYAQIEVEVGTANRTAYGESEATQYRLFIYGYHAIENAVKDASKLSVQNDSQITVKVSGGNSCLNSSGRRDYGVSAYLSKEGSADRIILYSTQDGMVYPLLSGSDWLDTDSGTLSDIKYNSDFNYFESIDVGYFEGSEFIPAGNVKIEFGSTDTTKDRPCNYCTFAYISASTIQYNGTSYVQTANTCTLDIQLNYTASVTCFDSYDTKDGYVCANGKNSTITVDQSSVGFLWTYYYDTSLAKNVWSFIEASNGGVVNINSGYFYSCIDAGNFINNYVEGSDPSVVNINDSVDCVIGGTVYNYGNTLNVNGGYYYNKKGDSSGTYVYCTNNFDTQAAYGRNATVNITSGYSIYNTNPSGESKGTWVTDMLDLSQAEFGSGTVVTVTPSDTTTWSAYLPYEIHAGVKFVANNAILYCYLPASGSTLSNFKSYGTSDLNNCTIKVYKAETSTYTSVPLTVLDGGTLNINGGDWYTNWSGTAGYSLQCTNNGNLHITNGKFMTLIQVYDSGNAVIDDGDFNQAISVQDGSNLTINGGTFCHQLSVFNTDATALTNSSNATTLLTVNDGTFNEKPDSGVARFIRVYNGAAAVINGGTINVSLADSNPDISGSTAGTIAFNDGKLIINENNTAILDNLVIPDFYEFVVDSTETYYVLAFAEDINFTAAIKDGVTSFPYTGSAIAPEVIVKANDTVLTLNTHYEVAYKNNVEVGNAKIEVTGIGEFEGKTAEVPFQIYSVDNGNQQAQSSSGSSSSSSSSATGDSVFPIAAVVVALSALGLTVAIRKRKMQ